MTWDEIEGQWKQTKGMIKERWGKLTDDDLRVIDGQRDQLVGILQKRYGRAREAIEREIDEFCNSCCP